MVSSDGSLFLETKKIVGNRGKVIKCSNIQLEDTLNKMSIAFSIIDFDKSQMKKGDFYAIIQIKSKQNIPILVLMEEEDVGDVLAVLSIGATEYFVKSTKEKYEKKIIEMFQWNRYHKWIEKMNNSVDQSRLSD